MWKRTPIVSFQKIENIKVNVRLKFFYEVCLKKFLYPKGNNPEQNSARIENAMAQLSHAYLIAFGQASRNLFRIVIN